MTKHISAHEWVSQSYSSDEETPSGYIVGSYYYASLEEIPIEFRNSPSDPILLLESSGDEIFIDEVTEPLIFAEQVSIEHTTHQPAGQRIIIHLFASKTNSLVLLIVILVVGILALLSLFP